MVNAQQEVEKKINDEIEKFQNSIYTASPIPSNILELFQKSYMALAPQFHKILGNKIKVIASKKIEELTISDLKDVVTLIVNTPPEKFFYNWFQDAVDGQIKMDKFILTFNNNITDFMDNLKLKKETLMNLSGARTGGMHSVPLNGQA